MRFTLLALVALAVSQPGAPSGTLDLRTFAGEVDRLAAEVAAVPNASRGAAFAATVPDRLLVGAGSRVFAVDLTWIDDDAAEAIEGRIAWNAARARIRRRLISMRADAVQPWPRMSGDPFQQARSVLDQQEFKKSPTSEWLERQRDRAARWISDLLERVFGSRLGSRGLATAFAWIAAVVALAAVATWLARTLARSSDPAALEIGTAPIARMEARQWARRALAAARAGDLREAMRLAYHAAISRLDEQGAWTIDESRTPREYVRLLPSGDPRHSPVADLTRRFEQIWYGHRAPTADDKSSMTEHLERLGCLRADDRAI